MENTGSSYKFLLISNTGLESNCTSCFIDDTRGR